MMQKVDCIFFIVAQISERSSLKTLLWSHMAGNQKPWYHGQTVAGELFIHEWTKKRKERKESKNT